MCGKSFPDKYLTHFETATLYGNYRFIPQGLRRTLR